MKYRPEKTAPRPPANPIRRIVAWIVGAPGYLILLTSWLGVFSSFFIWLLPYFYENSQMKLNADIAREQLLDGQLPTTILHYAPLPPLLLYVIGIIFLVSILYLIWLFIAYASAFMDLIAEKINKSSLVVRLTCLSVGCIVGMVIMGFQTNLNNNLALYVGLFSALIGIVSFVLEHLITNYKPVKRTHKTLATE